MLEDDYGNRFIYAELGRLSKVYAVPKERKLSASDFKLVTPGKDDAPKQPATEGTAGGRTRRPSPGPPGESSKPSSARGPVNTEDTRPRLYALPERPHNVDRADITGQLDQLLAKSLPGYSNLKSYFTGALHLDRGSMELKPLREGSHVVAGTVLGKVGKTDSLAPHVNFAIRPAGKGAPQIDPKPILDGWKLLEATAIYRAAGENPFTETAGTRT